MKQKQLNLKLIIFFIGSFLLSPALLSIAQTDWSHPQQITSVTSSGDWNSPTRTYSYAGESNIAVDSQGNWHIVYYESEDNFSPSGNTRRHEIKYLSSGMSIPVTVATAGPGQAFSYPSIALDPQDNPRITYGQYDDLPHGDSQYCYVYSIMYTQLQRPLEILDGVDFTAGREVSSDPEKLASGGTVVEGAVTDGVARLLLRLSVDKYEPVTFSLQGTGNPTEDGILRSIDGSQQGNSITVNPVEVSGKQYVFAIYQAPENFVRDSYQEEDKKVAERKLPIKVESSSGLQIEQEIKLVRPPVILVHGLWSTKKMWDILNTNYDFKGWLEEKIPGITIFTPSYTNNLSFKENKEVIKKAIIEAKESFKKQGIATVQADVLGHSMGGLLARIYAAGEDYYGKGRYLNDKNFKEGDINKLITLDSPHYGAFLADFASRFMNDFNSGVFEESDWAKLAALLLLIGDWGALEDLTTTSAAITNMNNAEIISKCHTIAGDYVLNYFIDEQGEKCYILPGGLFDFVYTLLIEFDYDVFPDIVTGRSDLVVSVSSQEGGLASNSVSVFGHLHTEATSEEVLNKTVELLNKAENSDSFSTSFPKR